MFEVRSLVVTYAMAGSIDLLGNVWEDFEMELCAVDVTDVNGMVQAASSICG